MPEAPYRGYDLLEASSLGKYLLRARVQRQRALGRVKA